MQQIHTRRQAADLGLRKYWTGRPCQKGHNDFRYTVSGACCHCAADAQAKYRPAPSGVTRVTIANVPRQIVPAMQAMGLEMIRQFNAGSLGEVAPLVAERVAKVGEKQERGVPMGKLPDGAIVAITRDYILEHGDPVIEGGRIVGHMPLTDDERVMLMLGAA